MNNITGEQLQEYLEQINFSSLLEIYNLLEEFAKEKGLSVKEVLTIYRNDCSVFYDPEANNETYIYKWDEEEL